METEERQQLIRIDAEIQRIKKAARALKELSQGMPAVDCNADRILASVKMLEINCSDLLKVN